MHRRLYHRLVLFGSLTLIGCSQPSADVPVRPANHVVFNASHAPTVEFSVLDMMCEEGCAATVKEILSRQTGVTEVQVDFERKTATVAVDETTFDSQQALAALIDKGFDNSQLADDAHEAQSSQSVAEAESQAPAAQ